MALLPNFSIRFLNRKKTRLPKFFQWTTIIYVVHRQGSKEGSILGSDQGEECPPFRFDNPRELNFTKPRQAEEIFACPAAVEIVVLAVIASFGVIPITLVGIFVRLFGL